MFKKREVYFCFDILINIFKIVLFCHLASVLGSGALSDKMLLVRIVENNEIDAHFREK